MSDLVSDAQAKDPEAIRELRTLEATAARLKAELDMERAKRQQAEDELADERELSGLMRAVEAHRESVALKPSRKSTKRGQSTPIICCNDWHAEGTIDSRTVSGLNEFNLDVAERRVQRLWEKAAYLIDFWRKVADIDDAILWLGGDMISGSIHAELEETNSLGPTDAINWVSDHVTCGIRFLMDSLHMKRMHVVCNVGNHGRTVVKPRCATAYQHSYESLAYNQLAKIFHENQKVSFQISRSYHAFLTLYDRHVVRFHHGDSIRYAGGVGGISIPVNKAISAWNKSRHADLDVFGHWHQHLSHWNWTACGCLVGIDAFAISIKADYQPPTQTLVVIDRDHGKVASLPIFVEQPKGVR